MHSLDENVTTDAVYSCLPGKGLCSNRLWLLHFSYPPIIQFAHSPTHELCRIFCCWFAISWSGSFRKSTSEICCAVKCCLYKEWQWGFRMRSTRMRTLAHTTGTRVILCAKNVHLQIVLLLALDENFDGSGFFFNKNLSKFMRLFLSRTKANEIKRILM